MKMMLAASDRSLDQSGGLGGRPIPDRDVVTGVQQASRHRHSHHPEPEIAELFGFRPVRPADISHFVSPCRRRKILSSAMALSHIPPGPGHDRHAPVACLIV